jgi:hypothetical protein
MIGSADLSGDIIKRTDDEAKAGFGSPCSG